MASQNKIIEMIGAVKTIYSYYAKETDVETLVKTWTTLLKNYEDAVVEIAFYKCLQICKMPPTPADVIEQIQLMQQSLEPSDEELWTVYEGALRETSRQMANFGATFIDSTGISQGEQARRKVDELYNGLPEKIKLYLASKSELMRNARDWSEDIKYSSYEKPRFMKSMPIMRKRQECSGLLLENGGSRLLLK